ncbi:MAG: hypothetical protein WKG01_37870, partial [Kofleriaceae bacterium]
MLTASFGLLVACGGGDDGDDDTPPDYTKYSLNWGPVTVAPAQEDTQCVDLRLSNTEAIKVHQMHNILGPGSHHLIVYKNDDPAAVERTTPYHCEPFRGALNLSGMVAPVMITQKPDDELTLPDGVAYTFAANQMIRLEKHFINTTDDPIQAMATSEFYAVAPSEIRDEANILFIGSPDIDLAPGETETLDQFFTPSRAQLDLTGAKFFAITGHTHQYGRDMQVQIAASAGAAKTSVYAPVPFQWAEPETRTHAPEFKMPEGASSGFGFQCKYTNTSGDNVGFGESANAEMCFFWAYYYPSKGSHVCFHSNNFGNLDICCPDAGPTLCNQ